MSSAIQTHHLAPAPQLKCQPSFAEARLCGDAGSSLIPHWTQLGVIEPRRLLLPAKDHKIQRPPKFDPEKAEARGINVKWEEMETRVS